MRRHAANRCTQAIDCATTRRDSIGYVGVPHGVEPRRRDAVLPQPRRACRGGPAPVRRFLPELIDLVYDRKINPGKVFDLHPAHSTEVADGYRAMDQRRAIKTLLLPMA